MELDRYKAFGEEIDALRTRIFARVGDADVKYVRRLDAFSRAMEICGRTLIHVSPEPVSFSLGVLALFVHKQIQAGEIGHSALHGAWDKLPGAEKYNAKTFHWDTPIEEAAWRNGHNVRHHGNTNVAGKDPDIHFGLTRLTGETPYAPRHKRQVLFTFGLLFPNFLALMNMHFTGLADAYIDNGLPEQLDFLPDRSKESVRAAWKKALKKWVPYYGINYVFFPALAGPFFWKVLLGNWLAETIRDVYCACTIICGHVGSNVATFPAGTSTKSRAHWYAMQVEASNDFDVPLPISILCGGLDKRIEHHLFPTLPPPRLREIAKEVRDICERHGVRYKSEGWGKTLYRACRQVVRLSRESGAHAVLREVT